MDCYSIEILKVLLEATEPLRNTEIREQVWRRIDRPTISTESWPVVCSHKLRELTNTGYLKREELGHMNVRYSFKDQKMKEKARLIALTQYDELERVLSSILEKEVSSGTDRTDMLEFLLMVPSVLFTAYNAFILRAIGEDSKGDLDFYKERERATLSAYRECMIDLVKKQDVDKLLKSEVAVPDWPLEDLKSFLSIEGLTKVFRKKMERT